MPSRPPRLARQRVSLDSSGAIQPATYAVGPDLSVLKGRFAITATTSEYPFPDSARTVFSHPPTDPAPQDPSDELAAHRASYRDLFREPGDPRATTVD